MRPEGRGGGNPTVAVFGRPRWPGPGPGPPATAALEAEGPTQHRTPDSRVVPAPEVRICMWRRRERVGLLDAVLAVSGEKELPGVLRRIVSSAMALVDARYGAIGILDDRHEGLQDFITLGLTEQEKRRLAGIGKPQGRGLLGQVIRHPEPLRVDDIGAHPESSGFPPGHPPMRTLLGTAIRVQGEVYGDLYLADRRDGRPFDADDQAVVLALAGAAGVAIEKARLLTQIRAGAERFQRLLLPTLPDLAPFSAAAHYRPAEGAKLGGDWYDAVLVPGEPARWSSGTSSGTT